MDLWVYPSRPKVPSWIRIGRIYSAQTFSYFILPNSVGESSFFFLPLLKVYKLLAERQMPAHHFLTAAPQLRRPAQRFPFKQTFIKLLNWKPSVSSFRLIYFLSFDITSGNRTLQRQLPFMFKWWQQLPSCYTSNKAKIQKVTTTILFR